jgi:hypothetical protein
MTMTNNIATLKKDIVSPTGQVISTNKSEDKQEPKITQLPEVKGYRIIMCSTSSRRKV